jgi:hypothetical protein
LSRKALPSFLDRFFKAIAFITAIAPNRLAIDSIHKSNMRRFMTWLRVQDFFEGIFINWQWYRKMTRKKYAFLCHKKVLFWSYNWE